MARIQDTRPAAPLLIGLRPSKARPAIASLIGLRPSSLEAPHVLPGRALHPDSDRGALRDPEGRRPDRDRADAGASRSGFTARSVAHALAGPDGLAPVPGDDAGRPRSPPRGVRRGARDLRRGLPNHAGVPD